MFPGQGTISKPLSNMAMLTLLSRMGLRGQTTIHGVVRSGLQDWAAETTDYPQEVIDMALAHQIKSAVERAYRRGDLLVKRTSLMQDWGRFLTSPIANVVQLRA